MTSPVKRSLADVASTPAEDNSPEVLVNASGHKQELDRNFGIWSLVGIGLTVGNVWPAVGGTILVAIFNGGPPGVLYEFVAVSIAYFFVGACIAELASAIPSSGGPYHWASVTPGPRYGRVIGFFAGYWNFFAWLFGAAATIVVAANTIVQMYALTHPEFAPQAWHVFVVYLIVTWMACLTVCFCNKALPYLNHVGMFFVLAGYFISIIVVTVMPGRGGRPPHATHAFVWKEWRADVGYPNGFVFVSGMLNGAYSVGAPDATAHLAEEIPYPQKNVPIAIALQQGVGFVTGFSYLVAILYAINDYDALFSSPFPLAEIYRQATGSISGAIGLLTILLLLVLIVTVGTFVESGRMLWALARDKATPFSDQLSHVNPKLRMPFVATLVCGALVTIFGCLYIGNATAFNALVGAFVLMSSSSFTAAILPHLLTGRQNIGFGPFYLKGILGYVVNFVACAYMIVWFVIYCFPFALPVDAARMNYTSLIWGGLTIFVTIWWFVRARLGYEGPISRGGIICEADLVKARSDSLQISQEVVP